LGEIHIHVGAHGLDDVDVRVERDPRPAHIGRYQRYVLEVLRADAHDQGASGAAAFQLAPEPTGDREIPEAGPQRAVLDGAGHEVHRGRPDEAGHEEVDGGVVKFLRRADLLQQAEAHDRDPVAQGHRLGLVVGHVDGGGAQPPLYP